jgi:hypothetical protein
MLVSVMRFMCGHRLQDDVLDVSDRSQVVGHRALVMARRAGACLAM